MGFAQTYIRQLKRGSDEVHIIRRDDYPEGLNWDNLLWSRKHNLKSIETILWKEKHHNILKLK
jgi:hypothetical protein